jgi:hypothetical protein
MCTVILPPGGYPIAVNKYSITFSVYFPEITSEAIEYEAGWAPATVFVLLRKEKRLPS